ncbi:MAG: transglycosylase domain-containing protein [Candidatus Gracilibacteria bacterium]|nr:transglycosylase domain-containing protein [Candidatus Gracilibacteria bacterium]
MNTTIPTKRKINTHYTRKTTTKKISNSKNTKKIIIYIIGFFVTLTFLISLVLYTKYIKDLPKVSELEHLEIAESSVIYDKDGNVLYKIFKEKRTYVGFDEIAKNMVNALVAGEDKRYWENPGVDIIGLARAGVYFILGKSDGGVKGTSTLTQQLIRNTILTNERSVERKVKEIYLAYKLTAGVSKEKILELYLNKISFGNNAFGIEEASKTYFSKQAKDLNVLESSILASIPKGPTYYSPYSHPDRLLGYPYTYKEDDSENITEILTQKEVDTNKENVEILKNFIGSLKGNGINGTDKIVVCGVEKTQFKVNYEIDNEGCLVLKYSDLLNLLNNIRLKNNNNIVEYQTGRKDFILGRMLEDGYITFDDYKTAISSSFGYTFNQEKENIKAPHFVFYIKEYLEEKYGKEIVSAGGLQIYTTIDGKLQEKAEEIVQKQVESNSKRFNATNAALISLDNENGGILAMVGGVDYFDSENKGNVNIITSKLQPGSSFKPFVYALGIFNKEIGSKTPIYDVATTFPGSYSPKNFDGKFMGKMNISTALNYSRNIPAIKMYYMAGGEASIISFMEKLGVKSLKSTGNYGAPLALGTGELTPLELATAYSVFANLGEKVEINPILKIVDSKGNIIEEKKETKKEKVISAEQSYVINSILSDTSSRPSTWNGFISLKSRPVAAKTGTSTKQYEQDGKKYIFPRNLLTIGYTPQITTVVWAGNTDGSATNMSGDGLNAAGPIWRDFMEYAHKSLPVKTWSKPKGVSEINISEITGLLPNPENAQANLLVKSLFVNKPTKYDNSFNTTQIDILCNGIVNENTPPAAIKNATLIEFHSLQPDNPSWEIPVQEWARSDAAKEKYGNIENLVTSKSNEICERTGSSGNTLLKSNIKSNSNYFVGENYVEIAYRSDNIVKLLEVLINGIVVQTIDTEGKKEGIYSGNMFLPGMYKNQTVSLEIRAVDSNFYSKSEINSINIGNKDDSSPIINMENPIDNRLKLYDVDFFNLKANIIDNSKITVIIYIDGIEYKNLGDTRKIDLPINSQRDLSVGTHTIKIEVTDSLLNKVYNDVIIEVLKK